MQLHGNPIKRQPLNRAPAIELDQQRRLSAHFFLWEYTLDKSKVSIEYVYTYIFDRDRFYVLGKRFYWRNIGWIIDRKSFDIYRLDID